eukprot:COSAG01_NODE_9520_length_2421_cov_17.671404_3_plen_208_part_00
MSHAAESINSDVLLDSRSRALSDDDDNSDVISKLKQRPSMTLYHCRPTAFTTALDIYLATSPPSLVSSSFECACVGQGSYAASCTSGANSNSCVCGGECVRACVRVSQPQPQPPNAHATTSTVAQPAPLPARRRRCHHTAPAPPPECRAAPSTARVRRPPAKTPSAAPHSQRATCATVAAVAAVLQPDQVSAPSLRGHRIVRVTILP